MAPAVSSRKRPYQPSIAAFFPRDENTTSLSIREAPTPSEKPPALRSLPPAHIQSSLLNVGMRIRKAIPGGYQTQKALELEQSLSGAYTPPRRSVTISPSETSRSRELQPYCSASADVGNAMHDIGGCGIQPSSGQSHASASMIFGDHDKENDAPSSQESNSSTDSMPHNKAKRGWNDGEEMESVALQSALETQDGPRVMMQQRIWARPRGRPARRRLAMFTAAPVPAVNALDFDEAEFLCGREECMDLT